MIKSARKPSSDPAQEKIRQSKSLLNKDISAFIGDLIDFKKTLNGWPSKFFKERSKITEPIPADPTTIIGVLAGDFQDIANRSRSIIQDQANYSKTRRQKQPKIPGSKIIENKTVPTPTLSQQLSPGLADDQSFFLISEGSNPLSRFFAHLLNPGIGTSEKARIRKYRMSLLTATANLYKDLSRLQKAVVGSGPQSIFESSKLMDKIEDNWIFINSGFNVFKNTMPQGVKDAGGKIENPIKSEEKPAIQPQLKSLEDVNIIIQDFKANANNFFNYIPKSLRQNIMKYEFSSSNEEKNQLTNSIITEYKAVLWDLAIKNNLNTNEINSLADVLNKMPKKTEIEQPISKLETVSQNMLGKWLGKTRHQISPFDKTSAVRLHIYNLAEESRKIINKIMDSLEQELNISVLESLLKECNDKLSNIRELMRGLTSTIRGSGNQLSFINMMESGRLGDYGINLEPKQKEHLDKMLKQKQLRELTHMYSRK